MRVLAASLVLVFLALAGCTMQERTEGSVSDTSPPVATPSASVWEPLVAGVVYADIHDSAFDPGLVTVERGNSVVWTNLGALTHSVVSDDGGFSGSGAIEPGQTFTFAFNGAGDFAYHCRFHPELTGVIRVR